MGYSFGVIRNMVVGGALQFSIDAGIESDGRGGLTA